MRGRSGQAGDGTRNGTETESGTDIETATGREIRMTEQWQAAELERDWDLAGVTSSGASR